MSYVERPCANCGCAWTWHYERAYKDAVGKEWAHKGCDAPLGYYGDEPCMCSGFKPRVYKARFDLNGLILD